MQKRTFRRDSRLAQSLGSLSASSSAGSFAPLPPPVSAQSLPIAEQQHLPKVEERARSASSSQLIRPARSTNDHRTGSETAVDDVQKRDITPPQGPHGLLKPALPWAELWVEQTSLDSTDFSKSMERAREKEKVKPSFRHEWLSSLKREIVDDLRSEHLQQRQEMAQAILEISESLHAPIRLVQDEFRQSFDDLSKLVRRDLSEALELDSYKVKSLTTYGHRLVQVDTAPIFSQMAKEASNMKDEIRACSVELTGSVKALRDDLTKFVTEAMKVERLVAAQNFDRVIDTLGKVQAKLDDATGTTKNLVLDTARKIQSKIDESTLLTKTVDLWPVLDEVAKVKMDVASVMETVETMREIDLQPMTLLEEHAIAMKNVHDAVSVGNQKAYASYDIITETLELANENKKRTIELPDLLDKSVQKVDTSLESVKATLDTMKKFTPILDAMRGNSKELLDGLQNARLRIDERIKEVIAAQTPKAMEGIERAGANVGPSAAQALELVELQDKVSQVASMLEHVKDQISGMSSKGEMEQVLTAMHALETGTKAQLLEMSRSNVKVLDLLGKQALKDDMTSSFDIVNALLIDLKNHTTKDGGNDKSHTQTLDLLNHVKTALDEILEVTDHGSTAKVDFTPVLNALQASENSSVAVLCAFFKESSAEVLELINKQALKDGADLKQISDAVTTTLQSVTRGNKFHEDSSSQFLNTSAKVLHEQERMRSVFDNLFPHADLMNSIEAKREEQMAQCNIVLETISTQVQSLADLKSETNVDALAAAVENVDSKIVRVEDANAATAEQLKTSLRSLLDEIGSVHSTAKGIDLNLVLQSISKQDSIQAVVVEKVKGIDEKTDAMIGFEARGMEINQAIMAGLDLQRESQDFPDVAGLLAPISKQVVDIANKVAILETKADAQMETLSTQIGANRDAIMDIGERLDVVQTSVRENREITNETRGSVRALQEDKKARKSWFH